MSKRHYILLAAALRRVRPFCDADSFNRAWFAQACGE